MADNISVTPGSGASIAADEVGGVKHQRVKISVGADGSASDMPAAADGLTAGVAPMSTALLNSGGSGYNRWRTGDTDGILGGYYAGAIPMLYNGATHDRQRGNLEGTLLASAARTTQTTTATQTNYNARGVQIALAVTAASGTGGLTVRIQGLYNALGLSLNAAPAAVTATGFSNYEIYPGASTATGDVVQRTPGALPRSWRVVITVGDASSYTYALDYALIL